MKTKANGIAVNEIIGRQICADGWPRDVYRDKRGQFIIDDKGRRIYGPWIRSEPFSHYDEKFEIDEYLSLRIPSAAQSVTGQHRTSQ